MTDDLFQGSHVASVYAFPLSDDQIIPLSSAPTYVAQDIDDEGIRALAPCVPVSIVMPDNLRRKAREFTRAFSGHVMYAVKCNPDPVLLRAMHQAGVRSFDVASIGEVRLVRGLFPDATLYFMHPVKAPEAIREAYVSHGVRAFVLDYADELDKILQATNGAPDLELFVRLAIPKDRPGQDVATDFSAKFGAKYDAAVDLLRRCRPFCARLGLSFHVGTQCQDPLVYSKAVAHAAAVISESGVAVEALDVGGGFPADLTVDHPVPAVRAFTGAITDAIRDHHLGHLELVCEIGRGLVACAGALVVRVEGRKGDLLYLNDGTYGGLFEAGGAIGLPYPARLIRRDARLSSAPLTGFRFAGPTCDSVDMMNGPFLLPDDIQAGDWIRLDQLGAYGEVSRTDFNGFGTVQKIIVQKRNIRQNRRKVAAIS